MTPHQVNAAALAARGPALATKLTDARHAIIRGEKPVSSWNGAVKDRRASDGDQIRGEFEQALTQNG